MEAPAAPDTASAPELHEAPTTREISVAQELRGIKRKFETKRADSPLIQEILTPSTGSRASTPHPGASEQDLETFVDACHDGYRWIRIPKERDYDLLNVPRKDPCERDTADLPLVLRRIADDKEVTMWAKMDTGAACNVINRSIVNEIFGEETEKRLRTITIAERGEFSLVGNNNFQATQYTVLSFRAGRSDRQFDTVRFIVIQDDCFDSKGDGAPNVILGWPFLKESSMMMIDVEYRQEADPKLEVIAERADKEKTDANGILITTYAQTRGVVRPPKRPK